MSYISSNTWNTLSYRHKSVCIYHDRNTHFLWAFFTQTQVLSPPMLPAEVDAVAPVSKARTKTSRSATLCERLWPPPSQAALSASPSFLHSQPLAFLMGCLLVSGCLLPVTSNFSHLQTGLYYSCIPLVMQKTLQPLHEPRILFLIQKQIHIPVQAFFPLFYSTKHIAVRKSPLTLITVTTSSV